MINNRECGMYFLYTELHAVIHTVHCRQCVTAVFDVTLLYNLLQYFDIMLYTIILLYLVCPSLLCAVGETSYGIQVGFIVSTQSSLFVYVFICI